MTDKYDAEIGSLAMLIGGKITAIVHTPYEEEEMWGLEIKVGGETKILWILRDFEGNGPGGWDIQ